MGWAQIPAKRSRGAMALIVASGVAGAVLAVGVLAATGSLGTRIKSHDVVERVRPALVTTGTTDADADRLAQAVAPSIVRLRVDGTTSRVGSGVVFRDDGHVLTNAHVIGGATTITATTASGHTVTAKVVGTDDDTDIAVLKLDGNGPFTPAVLGTTDGTAVGDPTVAVGANVSSGVVSALGREITPEAGATLVDMIQTDAEIDAASSGGALLAADGSVIGITTAYAGNSRLGFATPVDVARAVADDLLEVGRVRDVWLGIKASSAPDGGGVAVAEVITAGPAQQAGLTAGDVVRRVDGHPVATMSALRILLRRNHPGDPVPIVYDRNGTRHTAVVVLTERPPSS